jgi:cysteine-rich repeat protein
LNIYNNIVWGNTAGSTQDIISFHSDDDGNNIGNTVNLVNNDVSEFTENCSGGCTSTINQSNNLDVDPLFVDASTGNLHLLGSSPVINQGAASAPELPGEDIDGDPRPLGPAPDMGADEFTVCGDGAINSVTGEECDDGNTDDADGCDASCAVEDGFTCTGEPSVCEVTPTSSGGCQLSKIDGAGSHVIVLFWLVLIFARLLLPIRWFRRL